jgi:hypothetical protein
MFVCLLFVASGRTRFEINPVSGLPSCQLCIAYILYYYAYMRDRFGPRAYFSFSISMSSYILPHTQERPLEDHMNRPPNTTTKWNRLRELKEMAH